MASADIQRLVIQLDLAGNATSGVAKLNKQVGLLGRGTGRMAKGVGQVGAGIARAGLLLGGAAVGGITAAAKAGIEFEDAFAGVRKTVNETDLRAAGLSFESLAKDFREMATEMPLSANEFARIGEIAGALGVKAKDIKEFTRVTALMGVTTNLTADEAADSFGRIGTILGLTGKEYTELADAIVNLGNAGASTESEITEITKRFAAEAKAAGLNKEQIVALASATASLGFQPERGGTALARVFANMATNIALANSKGKSISKAIGKPIRELQRDINRGKGLPIFIDILEEIRDMNPTQAARFLKSIGVTNVSDRTIFRTMADQLPFVNEQLEIARKSQGALLKEAEKKFATTASKIQVFKNNLIESGIALSEGFLPAVGRALDKLTAAFKDPATKADIVQLGKDIGAAIDDIDWNNVLANARSFVGVLKGALDITLGILNAVNQLPTEIKAAGAAFLALEKLSGGLIGRGLGNIAGGAITAAASRIPGVGKLFAQPVFVTNWPVGFGAGGAGGIPPAAGGAAAIPAAAAVGAGAIVGAIKQGAASGFSTGLRESGIANTFDRTEGQITIFGNSVGTLLEAVRLLSTPGALTPDAKHGGMSPDERSEAKATQDKVAAVGLAVQRKGEQTVSRIDSVRAANLETKRETTRGINSATASARTTQGVVRSSALTGANITATATRTSAGAIIAAIYAARPIVNVTNVTRSTTIQNRYGPGNGSSGADTGHAPGTGPLP